MAHDDFIIDFDKIFNNHVFMGILVFLVGGFIGYQLHNTAFNEPHDTNEDVVAIVDQLVETSIYCFGSVCITENMTFAEARNQYNKFRNQPIAESAIVSTYRFVCQSGYG